MSGAVFGRKHRMPASGVAFAFLASAFDFLMGGFRVGSRAFSASAHCAFSGVGSYLATCYFYRFGLQPISGAAFL